MSSVMSLAAAMTPSNNKPACTPREVLDPHRRFLCLYSTTVYSHCGAHSKTGLLYESPALASAAGYCRRET